MSPEDVGGIPGYREMLETFANATKTAKKEYRDWLGLTDSEVWNVNYFSRRETNKRMFLVRPDV